LPGARHDMGAAREHGLLDALTDSGVQVIADSGYLVRVPDERDTVALQPSPFLRPGSRCAPLRALPPGRPHFPAEPNRRCAPLCKPPMIDHGMSANSTRPDPDQLAYTASGKTKRFPRSL
jgi:hypothetical protein